MILSVDRRPKFGISILNLEVPSAVPTGGGGTHQRNSQLIERGSIVERAAAPLASMPDGDETALSPL
eukprot:SAG31_NODE_17313_length_675_cov_3.701389_1_plen_66_part_01